MALSLVHYSIDVLSIYRVSILLLDYPMYRSLPEALPLLGLLALLVCSVHPCGIYRIYRFLALYPKGRFLRMMQLSTLIQKTTEDWE